MAMALGIAYYTSKWKPAVVFKGYNLGVLLSLAHLTALTLSLAMEGASRRAC